MFVERELVSVRWVCELFCVWFIRHFSLGYDTNSSNTASVSAIDLTCFYLTVVNNSRTFPAPNVPAHWRGQQWLSSYQVCLTLARVGGLISSPNCMYRVCKFSPCFRGFLCGSLVSSPCKQADWCLNDYISAAYHIRWRSSLQQDPLLSLPWSGFDSQPLKG